MKKVVNNWKLVPEKTSVSTLENLLDAKKIIEKKKIKSKSLERELLNLEY